MKIKVKTVKGEQIELEVESNWPVKQLKELIAQRCSVEVESQKLIFKAQQLSDDKTIEDYKILENECIILLTMKVP